MPIVAVGGFRGREHREHLVERRGLERDVLHRQVVREQPCDDGGEVVESAGGGNADRAPVDAQAAVELVIDGIGSRLESKK